MPQRAPDAGPVVLFDGVCNLCSAAVRYVIARDPRAVFRFASLQSEAAARLLAARGLAAPAGEPESIVLLDERGRLWERSDAALRIAARLRGPARLWALLLAVPRPLRDLVYRYVARNRYRWFGRDESCLVPTDAHRARFLDAT